MVHENAVAQDERSGVPNPGARLAVGEPSIGDRQSVEHRDRSRANREHARLVAAADRHDVRTRPVNLRGGAELRQGRRQGDHACEVGEADGSPTRRIRLGDCLPQ
jgi:hypothetical protein